MRAGFARATARIRGTGWRWRNWQACRHKTSVPNNQVTEFAGERENSTLLLSVLLSSPRWIS